MQRALFARRGLSGLAAAHDETERAETGEQKDIRPGLGDLGDYPHDGRDDLDRARHRDGMSCRYRDVVDREVEACCRVSGPEGEVLGRVVEIEEDPAVSVEATTPMRVSVTSTLPGVVLAGAVNETSRSKWLPVYVNGSPVKVNEPRLLMFGVPGAARSPRTLLPTSR